MSIQVRCHYDLSLGLDFDRVVENAARRVSSGGGTGLHSSQRDLEWSCKTESEAAELRQRLATCPEVTVR